MGAGRAPNGRPVTPSLAGPQRTSSGNDVSPLQALTSTVYVWPLASEPMVALVSPPVGVQEPPSTR